MNEIIKEIKHENITIKIGYDDYSQSPREWDSLGEIVGYHRHYGVVDKINCYAGECGSYIADFICHLKREENLRLDDVIYLPVYMYNHSGIRLATSEFSCPWDSGQIGYIYVPKAKVRAEYSTKRITEKLIEKVKSILKSEIGTFSQYLAGEIYAYEIINADGDLIDGCSGFYDVADAISEAKSFLDFQVAA